jgi:hypothetical protein
MIITEEELRQEWQNGRGRIPTYPPGTRFTPSALDFLKVREPGAIQASAPPRACLAATDSSRRELKAVPGQRLVYTALDVPDLLSGGGGTLVVHPSVTITHAGLEKLRNAGVRVVPYVESASTVVEAVPAAAEPRMGKEETLFRTVKEAVLARLGKPVDPAVLDAVLLKVLAAL